MLRYYLIDLCSVICSVSEFGIAMEISFLFDLLMNKLWCHFLLETFYIDRTRRESRKLLFYILRRIHESPIFAMNFFSPHLANANKMQVVLALARNLLSSFDDSISIALLQLTSTSAINRDRIRRMLSSPRSYMCDKGSGWHYGTNVFTAWYCVCKPACFLCFLLLFIMFSLFL